MKYKGRNDPKRYYSAKIIFLLLSISWSFCYCLSLGGNLVLFNIKKSLGNITEPLSKFSHSIII